MIAPFGVVIVVVVIIVGLSCRPADFCQSLLCDFNRIGKACCIATLILFTTHTRILHNVSFFTPVAVKGKALTAGIKVLIVVDFDFDIFEDDVDGVQIKPSRG